MCSRTPVNAAAVRSYSTLVRRRTRAGRSTSWTLTRGDRAGGDVRPHPMAMAAAEVAMTRRARVARIWPSASLSLARLSRGGQALRRSLRLRCARRGRCREGSQLRCECPCFLFRDEGYVVDPKVDRQVGRLHRELQAHDSSRVEARFGAPSLLLESIPANQVVVPAIAQIDELSVDVVARRRARPPRFGRLRFGSAERHAHCGRALGSESYSRERRRV